MAICAYDNHFLDAREGGNINAQVIHDAEQIESACEEPGRQFDTYIHGLEEHLQVSLTRDCVRIVMSYIPAPTITYRLTTLYSLSQAQRHTFLVPQLVRSTQPIVLPGTSKQPVENKREFAKRITKIFCEQGFCVLKVDWHLYRDGSFYMHSPVVLLPPTSAIKA